MSDKLDEILDFLDEELQFLEMLEELDEEESQVLQLVARNARVTSFEVEALEDQVSEVLSEIVKAP